MKKICAALILGVLAAGWLFLWPHVSLFATDDGEVFSAIHKIRANIMKYYEQTGKLPADLSEIYVPRFTVLCFTSAENTRLHRHRIKEVEIRPGAFPADAFPYAAGFADGTLALPPPEFAGSDSGKWIYDPESGWVVLDCSGVDVKHKRHWWEY